ncbi:hypothetical protein BDI01nite_28730 [Brevundimonas diminuta]|nr:hypothetical protein BDI01nite_28730 [Brevundimonas diminuta]
MAGLDPEATGEDIVEEIVRRRARDTHVVAEVVTRMQLGETYEARLIASRSGKAVVDLTRRTPEPTVIEERTPIVSEASAGLTSARFDITRTSPEWQSFAPGAPTVWTWTVKPKSAGRGTLTFHLYQRLGAGPESATIPVRSFPKDVEIQVSLWRRAYNSVRAVFTSVGGLLAILASIVAILAFYIEHMRRKKAANASGPSAAPAPAKSPPPAPAPAPPAPAPASPAKPRKSGRSKVPKEEEPPAAS